VPTLLGRVSLPQRLLLLPLPEAAQAALRVPFCPLTDDQPLPFAVAELGVQLSAGGLAAYIEAEFFGGGGTQASIVWNNGRVAQPVLVSPHAINAALAVLGVRASPGEDEFEKLGLWRFRSTEEWHGEARRPPSSRR
jgi:hypothetical protein